MYRLNQVARKLNVGRTTIIEFLESKGFEVDTNPNSKISEEQFAVLSKEFADSAHDKEEASELTIGSTHSDNMVIKAKEDHIEKRKEEEEILITDNVSFFVKLHTRNLFRPALAGTYSREEQKVANFSRMWIQSYRLWCFF